MDVHCRQSGILALDLKTHLVRQLVTASYDVTHETITERALHVAQKRLS